MSGRGAGRAGSSSDRADSSGDKKGGNVQGLRDMFEAMGNNAGTSRAPRLPQTPVTAVPAAPSSAAATGDGHSRRSSLARRRRRSTSSNSSSGRSMSSMCSSSSSNNSRSGRYFVSDTSWLSDSSSCTSWSSSRSSSLSSTTTMRSSSRFHAMPSSLAQVQPTSAPQTHVTAPSPSNTAANNSTPSLGSLDFHVGQDPFSSNSVVINCDIKATQQSELYRRPRDLILVIDCSLSMSIAPEGKPTALEQVQLTITGNASSLLNLMDPLDRVAIVTYDDEAFIPLPLTYCNEAGKGKVRNLIADLEAGGDTNIYDAIITAFEAAKHGRSADRDQIIYLLSDGKPNMPEIGIPGTEGWGWSVPSDGSEPEWVHGETLDMSFMSSRGIHNHVVRDSWVPTDVPIHTFGFETGDGDHLVGTMLLSNLARLFGGKYRHVKDLGAIRRVMLTEWTYSSSVVAKNVTVTFDAKQARRVRLRLAGAADASEHKSVSDFFAEVSHGELKSLNAYAVNNSHDDQDVIVRIKYLDTTTQLQREQRCFKTVTVPGNRPPRNVHVDQQCLRMLTAAEIKIAVTTVRKRGTKPGRDAAKARLSGVIHNVMQVHEHQVHLDSGCVCLVFVADLKLCVSTHIDATPFDPVGLGPMLDMHAAHAEQRVTDRAQVLQPAQPKADAASAASTAREAAPAPAAQVVEMYSTPLTNQMRLDLAKLDQMAPPERFRVLQDHWGLHSQVPTSSQDARPKHARPASKKPQRRPSRQAKVFSPASGA